MFLASRLFLVFLVAMFGVSCRKKPPLPPLPERPRKSLGSQAPPENKQPPALQSTPEKAAAQKEAKVALQPPAQIPRISIIIDDFGYSEEMAKPFLKAPFPIAIAILPRLTYSKWTSNEAKKAGKPVLLHFPLEALKDNQWLGPGALFTNMNDRDLKQTFTLDLATVPDAEGMNNHMGSKGSQDPRVAELIAEEAKEHHLYLIDSLTAPNSRLYAEARKLGVPAAQREIFLDNVVKEEEISKQFDNLIKAARANGKAIAIGHPRPETLKVLLKRLPELEQEHIRLVPVNELLETR